MSGTFKVDGTFFPVNPLDVEWRREQVGTKGTGEPVFSAYWSCTLDFSILDTTEKAFFHDKWVAVGLHTFLLPHPRDDSMFTFDNVAITGWRTKRFDVPGYAENNQLTLGHIYISGTTG